MMNYKKYSNRIPVRHIKSIAYTLLPHKPQNLGITLTKGGIGDIIDIQRVKRPALLGEKQLYEQKGEPYVILQKLRL